MPEDVIEDDVIVAPWVGPQSCENVLSVAVCSMDVHIVESISKALDEIHSKGSYRWKLCVLRCNQLEEVVKYSHETGRIPMDFVILGLDTRKLMCLDWSWKVLNQVHPDLRIRRVILVNALGMAPNRMAVSGEDLLNLQTDSKLEMLNADVFKKDQAIGLARRLLNCIEVAVGVKTGFPNLNI